jgi:hypothetical protein
MRASPNNDDDTDIDHIRSTLEDRTITTLRLLCAMPSHPLIPLMSLSSLGPLAFAYCVFRLFESPPTFTFNPILDMPTGQWIASPSRMFTATCSRSHDRLGTTIFRGSTAHRRTVQSTYLEDVSSQWQDREYRLLRSPFPIYHQISPTSCFPRTVHNISSVRSPVFILYVDILCVIRMTAR